MLDGEVRRGQFFVRGRSFFKAQTASSNAGLFCSWRALAIFPAGVQRGAGSSAGSGAISRAGVALVDSPPLPSAAAKLGTRQIFLAGGCLPRKVIALRRAAVPPRPHRPRTFPSAPAAMRRKAESGVASHSPRNWKMPIQSSLSRAASLER